MKKVSLAIITILILSSCDKHIEKKFLSKDIDPNSVKELTSPIENEFNSPIIVRKKSNEPEFIIPELLKQKVSISLNETLPIKSALYETAKKLKIDFQIDPSINTSVIFSAHDLPFIEVLDAVCDLADLRYTITGNFVKVVKDIPYTNTYTLQFLNFSRDSENKISISTEVSSAPQVTASPQPSTTSRDLSEKNSVTSSNGSSSSTEGNANSSVVVKTKNDFWAELDNGIKVITGNDKTTASSYSVNRQSGIITVNANSKVQKYVKQYIDMVKKSTETQVLIEAKIIEVTLKNEYKRGIDWNFLAGVVDIKNTTIDSTTTSFAGNFKATNMGTILNALENFGSMRTVSNPRITAMNNQAAILKVAENHVYFRLNYDKSYATSENGHDSTTVSSEVHTVPIGLVMFVQPSVDVENGTITLFLRPTISKLSGTVTDPAVDIAIRSMEDSKSGKYEPSKIPVIEVREVSSVLNLKNGEVAILGGFMEIRSSKNKNGIPFAKDLPILGRLTGAVEEEDQVVELVILIKVRISSDDFGERRTADTRLQRFVPDPRPF
ncbi:MAG: hypothetical protein LBI26_00065 [Holosporales bacterium]|jgi:general secretion pathway protein D|nr:hypothetical protein [Holosporales bacterium]